MIKKVFSGLFLFCLFFSNIIFAQEIAIKVDSTTREQARPNVDIDAAQAAKIYFHRNTSMLGAAVLHLVVDRSDELNANIYIDQKKEIPEGKKSKMANIRHMYFIAEKNKNILLVGRPQTADVMIDKKVGTSIIQNSKKAPPSLEKYFKAFFSMHMNFESLEANSRVVGSAATSHTISWERPAGTMQLDVITQGGDQVVAPSFEVEAGKTYMVKFFYAKSEFEITEINEEEYLKSQEE